jgi:hypothetical protein
VSISITYDATLSRVRITGTPAAGTIDHMLIERSANGSQFVAVRGGSDVQLVSGSYALDDYEFAAGVLNTYRARAVSPVDVVLSTETGTITPSVAQVWLKSIARPFLNIPVTVIDYSEISRASRAVMFDVPGRSAPIRVGDVASSRGWTVDLLTRTPTEAKSVEFLVASGDVVYVQVPPDIDIPGGYVDIGSMSRPRISRTLADERRRFSLPMTNIAAPPPTIVGTTSSWAGILADFGSWTAVLAAFPTWADVLQYVSDPETVVVP